MSYNANYGQAAPQYPARNANQQQSGRPQLQPVYAVPAATGNPTAVYTPAQPANQGFGHENGVEPFPDATLASQSSTFRRPLTADDFTGWPAHHQTPFDADGYCVSKGFSPEKIAEARSEHVETKLSMLAGPKEFRADVGTGIFFYFEYVKFLAASNFLLVTLQVINYSIWAGQENPSFSTGSSPRGQRNFYHDFFITLFTNRQLAGWMSINIIAIVLCFLSAPIYYFIMRARVGHETHKPTPGSGERDEESDRMLRYIDADGSLDVSSYYRTTSDIVLRRIVAVVISACFLAVQVLASYYVTRNESTTNFGLSLLLAFIAATINILYGLAAKSLTEFEKWPRYAQWKRSQIVKLLLFKLLNIVTVYASKDYDTIGRKHCTYDVIGEQFLTLLLVEIIVMNLWAIIQTALSRRMQYWIADVTGSINGDQDNLPGFDLATEYLEVIYRQFIAIMAMTVFPLSIVLHFVGLFIEYWCDKFRLNRLCGKPQKMAATQKGFLSVTMGVIALSAIATPFAGLGWIMSGYTRDTSKFCTFP